MVLLLLLRLPPGSEGECCDSITISLPKGAEEIQPEKMGTYKKEASEEQDGKPVFTLTTSGLWKLYHINYEKDEGWVVNTDTGFQGSDMRTRKQDTRACPTEYEWEYLNINKTWVSSPKLEVKCDQDDMTIGSTSTTTTIASQVSSIPKEAFIGGGSVVALVLIVLLGCAVWGKYKQRDTTFEDDQVDDNPVYMYDYADADENNEIYDTNAYYAANDVREGTTLVTDLNPEYESSL